MADLHDLQRAVRETAEHAAPPAFADLVARARTRRRHRVLGSGAAAVLLLAGAAAVLLPHDNTAGLPPVVQRPTPTATPTTDAQRLRAMTPDQVVDRGHLAAYSASGPRTLGVWRLCVGGRVPACRFAWRLLDDGAPVRSGSLPGDQWPHVVPVAAGFVLAGGPQPPLVIRDDGATPAGTVDGEEMMAGDVVLPWNHGFAMVDPTTPDWLALAPPPGADGVVAAVAGGLGDSLWALPAFAGPGRVEVERRDGHRWTLDHAVADATTGQEVPAMLAATGASVAA
ncbi:MAG: hypothetical protein ACXVW6_10830, partial [Nocardioidaceae bacterium]